MCPAKSTLALVVVLTAGGAYAADHTPEVVAKAHGLTKNSVASQQIKDGSIEGKDIKDGALSGTNVADGSLSAADVKDGSVSAGDLAAGTIPPSTLGYPSIGIAPAALADESCRGTSRLTLTRPARVLVI